MLLLEIKSKLKVRKGYQTAEVLAVFLIGVIVSQQWCQWVYIVK